jgi:glycosyltransferase involved in cell wall biosynthesis
LFPLLLFWEIRKPLERRNKVDLVSIIVPVFNSEPYLADCVQSVVGQSHAKLELILIDDGSTDGSGKLCDGFAQQDNRIRISHIANGGPAKARNLGLEMCCGKWVMFLDADDTLEADAISMLIQAAETNEVDLVIGDFTKIRERTIQNRNDIIPVRSRKLTAADLTEQALLYTQRPNRNLMFAYAWGRLFKTSIIREHGLRFNSDQWTFEDVAFNFEYLRYVQSGFFLKTSVYRHTIHTHFASATMAADGDPGRMFGFIPTLSVIADFLRGSIPDRQIEQEVGHARISLTIIQTVRVCARWTEENQASIKKFIKQMADDPLVRRDLKYYLPVKGDSKMIPWLIKTRLTMPIIWTCRYKAHKRYRTSPKV